MTKWIMLAMLFLAAPVAAQELFDWEKVPPIPVEKGVAGSFAGYHAGIHLVAGGTNFPVAPPWDGGKKQWWDAVYTLASGSAGWNPAAPLKRPLGHGASITTSSGILLIGGGDSIAHYSDVLRVTLATGVPLYEQLPALPWPLAFHSAAAIGTRIYVCGGISSPGDTEARRDVVVLDLGALAQGWQVLEPMPGAGRIMPVAASLAGSLYVAGGASLAPDAGGKATRSYLRDGFRFAPGAGGWESIADMPRAAVAAPVPAPQLGPSHFAVLGGDTGENLPPIVPLSDHPGFSREILAYHSITNTWAIKGELPFGQVTSVAYTAEKGAVVVPSGEVRPGVRTPAVWSGSIKSTRRAFGWLNYTAIGIYFLGILILGVMLGGKNATTDEYFRGGQHIPWWAAGLSIFATMSSSIGYLAIPAKAYATNWVYMLSALPILMLAPIVIRYYLPFFRRIDATSAYEYLERRFNLAARLFGSFAFLLFHLGRMAIVLYLPALAIATVTSLDTSVCIMLMGVFSLVYSSAGGVRAVIWTDVIQSFVLLGGLLISLGWIIAHVDGGAVGFLTLASDDGKFQMIESSWSPSAAALWVVIVGNLFANLLPYTADQAVVQRYMTTKSEKAAARSIWLNGILSVPNTVLMFLIGSALYAFYKSHPDRLASGIQTDAIFPLFIAQELPAGIAGIAVAGILAAAQSTVSTSINSISTVAMVDVVGRFKLTKLGQNDIRLAKWISVAAGLVGTGIALWLARGEDKSLWDLYINVLGLTGGPLAGVFALGIFTRRATGVGSIAGVCAALVALFWVQRMQIVHPFLYAAVGVLVTFGVGYIVSSVTPVERKNVEGLTIFTLSR